MFSVSGLSVNLPCRIFTVLFRARSSGEPGPGMTMSA
jgi:hypothetical protein